MSTLTFIYQLNKLPINRTLICSEHLIDWSIITVKKKEMVVCQNLHVCFSVVSIEVHPIPICTQILIGQLRAVRVQSKLDIMTVNHEAFRSIANHRHLVMVRVRLLQAGEVDASSHPGSVHIMGATSLHFLSHELQFSKNI